MEFRSAGEKLFYVERGCWFICCRVLSIGLGVGRLLLVPVSLVQVDAERVGGEHAEELVDPDGQVIGTHQKAAAEGLVYTPTRVIDGSKCC